MTHGLDVARGRDVVARWCALAEQRLEYLTELFETGRWRRYHSESAFLENIQEAKAAVETWRDLATREASRDNSAIDLSWLGHTRTPSPRREILPDQLQRLWPPPMRVAAESQAAVPIAEPAELVRSDQAPSVPECDPSAVEFGPEPVSDGASALTLDIAVMQQRYPLLRNAL
jgi:uncharacterized repeat protein (TIGR03809 family)